jgi:hypothetical protein
MAPPLLQQRTIWWPTRLGWATLLFLGVTPVLLWFFAAESFFSHTRRLPADVLIVEGWIGFEGVGAAKAEFDRGNYRYIISSGSFTESRWTAERWNYATETTKHLIRLGLTADRIITAPALATKSQRTHTAAVAVRDVLRQRGLQVERANVFTLGAHARRSRLIFAKVLRETEVGVISWQPPEESLRPWWKSSERAEALLKETAGFPFELLLNSGRFSNSPPPPKS